MNKKLSIDERWLTDDELEELERLITTEVDAERDLKKAREAITKFLNDRPNKSRDIFREGDRIRKEYKAK